MIKNQKLIISVFFFALLLFVMAQLLTIFKPFFQAFFWASILTFGFYPVYARLAARVGPSAAAAATTLAILVIVIVPALLVLATLIQQTLDLTQRVSAGAILEFLERLRQTPWLQSLQLKVARFELLSDYLDDWSRRIVQGLGDFTTSQIASWTKNILLIFFNVFVVVFLLYFLLRDGERFYRYLHRLVPLEARDKDLIFSKVNDTFASVIRGQFLTSLTQATITAVTFAFLDLPASIFFGFVTFITTLIPVLGATAVWLPCSIVLFLNGEIARGAVLFAVGLLVISLIDNFLKPILIGERIKVPVFLLFFGVLGGLKAYGITGIFLGPLFIALFFVLIRIYQERYQGAGARGS
jgi:predicted PurR-regulated permease PerM